MRHSASMLRESIDHHCIPLSKGSVMRSFDLFCFSSSLGLISCWINKRPHCWWLETSWRILCFDSWGDSSMIFTRDFVTRENRQLVTKIGIHGSPYIIIYISHESSSTNDIMAKKTQPTTNPGVGWQVGGSRTLTYATGTKCATWFGIDVRVPRTERTESPTTLNYAKLCLELNHTDAAIGEMWCDLAIRHIVFEWFMLNRGFPRFRRENVCDRHVDGVDSALKGGYLERQGT